MSTVRLILGILVILTGIFVGVYIDVVVLFVGGIKQIVDGVNATPYDGNKIAWGAFRAFCLGGVGVIVTFVVIVFGLFLVGRMPKSLRR